MPANKGASGDGQTRHHSTPPDGGWGWLVTLGNFVCMMILCTMGPCFGILFGPRLQELGAPPSLATWLFNGQAVSWNLAGPWTGALTARFGYRKVAVTGAFVCSVSFFLSAVVPSPYFLLFTFSLMHGCGGGITLTCCFHMLYKYFDRRRGLANGIMVIGGSIGIILLPQVASKLQQEYPFAWATAITGAISLNTVAAALLLHPVEWHQPNTTHPCESVEQHQPLSSIGELRPMECIEERRPLATPGGKKNSMPRGSSVPVNLVAQGRLRTNLSFRRMRTISESPNQPLEDEPMVSVGMLRTLSFGGSTLMGSVMSVVPPPPPQTPEADGDVSVWKQVMSSFNPSVLRDPVVATMALFNGLSIVSAINLFASLPFVLYEAGFSLQQAATAMSVAAVADLLTRACCTFVLDLPCLRPRLLYVAAQIIFIFSAHLLFVARGEWLLVMACAACFGCGLGILYVLDVFILVHTLGVEKLPSALGMTQLARSLGFLTIGPIGGVLRGAWGGYWASYVFYSCTMAVGTLLVAVNGVLTTIRSTRQGGGEDKV